MQVTISIDKDIFNDSDIGTMINDMLMSMTKEEKSTMMKEFVMQYLNEESVLRNYFISRSRGWGGQTEYIPSTEFRELISKIDLSTDVEDIKNKMIEIIKGDFNDILISLFISNFVKMLSNSIINDREFTDTMSSIIRNKFNN